MFSCVRERQAIIACLTVEEFEDGGDATERAQEEEEEEKGNCGSEDGLCAGDGRGFDPVAKSEE